MDNFQIPDELTQTGAQSHYANGKALREIFAKEDGGFLSDSYDPAEVYVQTSFKQRTIDSALAQLDGLFAKPLAFPDIDPEFKLNVVPEMDDFIIHNVAKHCPRLSQIIDDVNAQSATKAMLAKIDSDLESTLFPELRQITKMPDATTKDMHDVCSYLFWANANGLTLTFTLTETQLNQCSVSY